MKPLIIYVAGPFRAKTAWGIEQNVRSAETQAHRLVMEFGVMPLIPHANTRYFHGIGSDHFWLEGTLELMRRCDAVYLCPGWEDSRGSVAEKDEAQRLGIPVFTHNNLFALRKWITRQKEYAADG
jgi:hypothetical protein